jgi:hypothetical protein
MKKETINGLSKELQNTKKLVSKLRKTDPYDDPDEDVIEQILVNQELIMQCLIEGVHLT